MKQIALMMLLALTAWGQLVTITGPFKNADGTAYAGAATIQNFGMTCNGFTIPANVRTVTITAGEPATALQLYATTSCNVATPYYSVRYRASGSGAIGNAFWQVPATPTTTAVDAIQFQTAPLMTMPFSRLTGITGTAGGQVVLFGDGAWRAIAQSHVAGLVAALAGKQSIIETHTVGDLPPAGTVGRLAVVTDAATAGSCVSGGGSAQSLCRDSGFIWSSVGDGGSGGGGGGGCSVWGCLGGTIALQTDLKALLDAKAAIVHSHVIEDTAGLAAALLAKEPAFAALPASKGGFGADVSAAAGLPFFTAGSAAFITLGTNLAISGGVLNSSGGISNTGTPVARNVPVYTDTTGGAVAPSGLSVDTSGNATTAGTVTTGDGTVAGGPQWYELAVNGNNYRRPRVPDVLDQTLELDIAPNGVPSGDSLVLFHTPTGTPSYSTSEWVGTTGTGNVVRAASPTISGTPVFSGITGSTQCLQVNSSGAVSGAGAACGSGSGSGSGAPNSETTFTSATSVSVTHSFAHKRIILACYDASENVVEPTSITIGSGPAYTVTVAFATAQTGRCVVNGMGTAKYSAAVSSATTWTVAGSTHALGTCDVNVAVYDGSSPTQRVEPGSISCDSSTKDIVVSFAVAQSGRITIQ